MIDYGSLLTHINKTETCKPLIKAEALAVGLDFFREGVTWELDTDLSLNGKYVDLKLFISFPKYFPIEIPKIFIDQKTYDVLKYIPHVNHDYSICIFDDGLSIQEPESVELFLDLMVARAKKVIRDAEDADYCRTEFAREFKAYWEVKYSATDQHYNLGLFSIRYNGENKIEGIRFINPSANFNYLYFLYDNEEDLVEVQQAALLLNVQYEKIEVLTIEQPLTQPPFAFSHSKSLELINQSAGKYETFKEICKNTSYAGIVVAFLVKTNKTIELYGWDYASLENLPRKLGGARNPKSKIDYINLSLQGKEKVRRLTFDNFSFERLQNRTTGYSEANKSIALSGVGSIGSNLLYFLKNSAVTKFNLIDKDVLSVENINRHLLGFAHIGRSKVAMAQTELKRSNPLFRVKIKENSVVDIVDTDSEFINECDLHIVAVGKSTIEKFILNKIKEGILTKPTIFLWVEPFLAAGHMVYIRPEDVEKLIELFENYPYNILKGNQRDKTYIVEGSCQSGFFPYSSSNQLRFLASIYPSLLNCMEGFNNHSFISIWIGNKDLLAQRDLDLTVYGAGKTSYQIIEEVI
jgi:hypothetical protein